MKRSWAFGASFGMLALLGISAYASTTGASASHSPEAERLAAGLESFADTLDGLNALEELAQPVAFTGLLPTGPDGLRLGDVFRQALGDRLQEALTNHEIGSIADLDAFLDDPDGANGAANDGSYGGVVADITGAITNATTGVYDVSLTVSLARNGSTPISLPLTGVDASGGPLTTDLDLTSTLGFRLNTALPAGQDFGLTTASPPSLALSADVDANFTGTPYTVNLGISEVAVTGTADIGADFAATILDPTPDGLISQNDWLSTTADDLFDVRFDGSHANLGLTLTSDVAGVPTGTISLTDGDLSTAGSGIGTPAVALGGLGDFHNMTPADFLSGLANVAGSLDAIQQSVGDLDLPLMQDRLSELVSLNTKLKSFFTSNGLSTASAPLTIGPAPGVTAEQFAATLSGFDTVQEVRDELAETLGAAFASLGMAYDAASHRLSFTLDGGETLPVLAGDDGPQIDLANQLARVGLSGVEDAATDVSLTPSYDLDFGLSVDLTAPADPNVPPLVLDRFAVETSGVELGVDAPITANLDLVGRIGFLGLELSDSADDGDDLHVTAADRVPLLTGTSGTPMLAVDLDGGSDNLLTLRELFGIVSHDDFDTDDGSIAATVTATVPPVVINAGATLNGTEAANGTITLGWPNIGAGGEPTAVANGEFNTELLDFSFNTEDPLALFSQITSTISAFADQFDNLAENAAGEVLSRDLPFAGKSFDDIANKFSEVSTKIDALLADPPATLQALESRLETELGTALGITDATARANILGISLDGATPETDVAFNLSYALSGTESLPFTFGLGDGNGGISATGTGGATLTYDAQASLDFGVTLPAVTAGTAQDSVPSVPVGAVPTAWVADTTKASLKAGVTAGGTLGARVGPLELSLGKSGDEFEAKLAAGFTLDNDVSPTGTARLTVPSSDFTNFVTGLVPATIRPATADRVSCTGVPLPGPFDACARIPVYADPTDPALGTITLTWDDLTSLTGTSGPQIEGEDDVLAELIARGLDWGSILDGMEQVLGFLEDSLDGASFGEKIPLIGDSLSAGAKVAELFRTEVVNPLQGLEAQLEAIEPDALAPEIQDFFVDALAVPGGTLLKDRLATTPGPDRGDVVVTVLCDDGLAIGDPGGDAANGPTVCLPSHTPLHLYDVQVGFSIGQTGATGTPLNFDIGLPGLRLEMTDDGDATTSDDNPNITATATWELDLAFGLSAKEGFYLRTDNPNNEPLVPADAPEFTLTAGVALPGSPLKGDIAFLPFELKDNTQAPGTNDLNLSLGLNLLGGGSDKRLSFTELTSALDPTNDAGVAVTLGGDVNLDLHIVTGPLPGEDSAVPKFLTDFVLDWDFPSGILDGNLGNLSIAFNNVSIDLGSLLGDFLGPILGEASRLTKPLKPVVDIVTAPIPGVTDAAQAVGCPLELPFPEVIADINLCEVSLLDLYEKMSGTDVTLIRQLISLINFINAVDDAGGQPTINLGSFKVFSNVAKGGALSANDKGKLYNPNGLDESSVPKPLQKLVGAIKNVVADAQKTAGEKGGFTFPAFDDPTRLFKMLLGQDVTLIHWDAGSLDANVTVPIEIGPPLGPLPLSLGITFQFGLRGHFAVGYDTRGIRLAVQRLTDDDDNNDGFLDTIGTLFAGIGLDDRLRVNGEPTGEDVPEITLYGSVVAKAALDAWIVEIGVRGGVEATLDANLHDGGIGPEFHTDLDDKFSHHAENMDGVLRIDEIASALSGNPLCMFDYTGKLTAFLEAYIDYTLGEESFRIIGPVTIADFSDALNSACDEKPDLASVKDGNLVLHMGSFASERGFQPEKINESFVVRQLDEAGTRFSISAFGFEEAEDDVTGVIYADGGSGNDTITLEPGVDATLGEEPPATGPPGDTVVTTLIPFTRRAVICGGPGIDTITTGSGDDRVVGDGTRSGYDCTTAEAGTDEGDSINTSAGVDTVYGTGGGDKIQGGAHGDTLDGGTGNDLVVGGPGGSGKPEDTMPLDAADTIQGGPDDAGGKADKDTIMAGRGGDTVHGGDDDDTIDGDEDGDFLFGGPGQDKIHGRAGGDDIQGEAGHDELNGNEGGDTLSGGDGDDDLLGEAGDDTLNGGNDNDDLVGGTDNTGVKTDVTGDTLNGGDGRDYALGDDGTITRATGQADGVMVCVGTFRGNDEINGGADPDVLQGCEGIDAMHGNAGTDLMFGGGGDDDMFGDADADQMFGDGGADDMEGNAGDDQQMRGGSGADTMSGNDGVDHMFGDDGGDTMFGNAGADKLWGGLDGDCMAGNGGSDVLNGDGGDDRMVGGSASAGAADEGDELIGNTGRDTIAGDNASLCDGKLVLHDVPFVGTAPDENASGSDTITGGDQDDVLYGQSEDDAVYGGADVDYLEGNSGRDTMDGQGDQDDIIGGSGHDNGGAGGAIRQLRNVVDDEVVVGGTAKGDFLHGGTGVDYIAGDNADIRRVSGGGLFDPASAGRSVELYEVQKVGLPIQPDVTTYGDDDLFGDAGNDAMFGQGDDDRIRGDVGDDYAEGNSGADDIKGDAGRDDLIGGGSANGGVIGVATKGDGLYDDSDTIYGESDTSDGTALGDGDDVIAGDNARITEPTDGSAIPGVGRAVELFDVETVTGSAVSPDTHGPETLYGNSNNDYIFGQGDIDTVHGGAGNDYAEGNTGADVIYGGEGRDDLIGGGSANGGIIGPLTSGTGLLDTGDTIYGESDTSDGTALGNGGDAIAGDNARITPLTDGTALPGLDRLVVLYDVEKPGANVSADTNGPEILYGNSNDDFIFGQGDKDVIHGGAGNDYGEGNAGEDTLYGETEEDDLIGGGSAADGVIDPDRDGTGLFDEGDRIYGGAGEDVLSGDNALISRTRTASGLAWQTDAITLGHHRGVKLFDTARNAADEASGNDLVLGGDQRDREFGQGGNDTVKGNAHDDFIEGNQGGDLLEGNFGEDDIIGGSRTNGSLDEGDIIHGGGDADVAIGDNGVIDRVRSTSVAYYYETYQIGITSQRYIRLLDIDSTDADVAGSDRVSGGSQVDTLFGQAERDYIFGGTEDDYEEGNGGSDFEWGDSLPAEVVANPPAQLGTLPGLPGGLPLENVGDLTPESAEPLLSGNPGAHGQDDIIGGNSKDNIKDEGDYQYGNGAADFIIGDNGTLSRSIVSGAYPMFVDYNPTTIVRAVNRFCTNAAAELTCESQSEFGGDYQEGNAGDDYMWGQDGADEMYGGTENDDVYGELQADRMFGEDGEDAMFGDRGGFTDKKLTSSTPGVQDTTQGPTFFNYKGLYKDQLDRRADMTKDFGGGALPHPGMTQGGDDYMSGGRNHDSMHGEVGDDVMNGDSGGDYMFGGDGGDAIWGGRGSDTNKDARHEASGPNTPQGILTDNMVDMTFGGYGGSATSVGGAFTGGSDIIDWRPRPDDPLAWRQITHVDDDTDNLATRTNNQHHQGIDWIYGGWDRDVMQGDLGKNGPDFQDRLLDWVGAYNLYSRCNASYGDDGDVRQLSPDAQRFIQNLAYGSGAGTSFANVGVATGSGGREMALVYNADIKENNGKAYPTTPGHFDNPFCNQP